MADLILLMIYFGLSACIMFLMQRIAMFLSTGIKCTGFRSVLFELSNLKPRSILADFISAMVGLQIFSLFFLLSTRPVISLLLTLSVGILLIILNYTKEKILHEPLVLVDVWLLKQAVKFPELYIPFLPVKKLIYLLTFVVIALFFILQLEQKFAGLGWLYLVLLPLTIFILPLLLTFLMWQSKLSGLADFLLGKCPVGDDASLNARNNGPLTAALLHPVACGVLKKQAPDFLTSYEVQSSDSVYPKELANFVDRQVNKNSNNHAINNLEQNSNLVLIQAESFWDIRPYYPVLNTVDLLPNWDKLKQEGGVLEVAINAFGAYTMRTEFRVLTGLKSSVLGAWAFNPYLLASNKALWSVARHLKQLNYTSLCLHPYFKNFFNRDLVLSKLGFDRFLGLESMLQMPRFGPYVSDNALADLILLELGLAQQAMFCFVITMEAHGPWLKGRLTEEQVQGVFDAHALLRKDFTLEEQYYIVHLSNMDKMFGKLRTGLTELSLKGRTNKLLVYSDHPPSLPALRAGMQC